MPPPASAPASGGGDVGLIVTLVLVACVLAYVVWVDRIQRGEIDLLHSRLDDLFLRLRPGGQAPAAGTAPGASRAPSPQPTVSVAEPPPAPAPAPAAPEAAAPLAEADPIPGAAPVSPDGTASASAPGGMHPLLAAIAEAHGETGPEEAA